MSPSEPSDPISEYYFKTIKTMYEIKTYNYLDYNNKSFVEWLDEWAENYTEDTLVRHGLFQVLECGNQPNGEIGFARCLFKAIPFEVIN